MRHCAGCHWIAFKPHHQPHHSHCCLSRCRATTATMALPHDADMDRGTARSRRCLPFLLLCHAHAAACLGSHRTCAGSQFYHTRTCLWVDDICKIPSRLHSPYTTLTFMGTPLGSSFAILQGFSTYSMPLHLGYTAFPQPSLLLSPSGFVPRLFCNLA